MTAQSRQCIQIVGATASRRHRCSRPATRGDYCTQHANHPMRRTQERIRKLWTMKKGNQSGA